MRPLKLSGECNGLTVIEPITRLFPGGVGWLLQCKKCGEHTVAAATLIKQKRVHCPYCTGRTATIARQAVQADKQLIESQRVIKELRLEVMSLREQLDQRTDALRLVMKKLQRRQKKAVDID